MSKFKKKPFYRLNQQIQADKVRLIDEKGKQIGVLSLGEALSQANQKNLDLIEVAPKAKPPVCKIINFKKFLYLENKKNKSKKGQRKSQTKEFRLKPFIAQNDLETRLKRAQKFLKQKNQLKFIIRFRGRQITRKEFGYELLGKVARRLSKLSRISQEPKFVGRQLIMSLSPDEKKETKDQKLGQKKV
ncbi:translation initiation factor IF-3 [Patescibacteria group bacterium]